ncbi:MAG: respiratory nitrate reductase subunit gamma [Pseudomonadota bacterium]
MLLLILSYLGIGIFVVVILGKIIKYFTMPLHLRWELYPLPHEKGREYGGSYFEELDWWEKPIEKSMMGQVKFMIPEILFVRALYHDNRKLWYVSFPFHFGLYLVIACMALLFVGAVVNVAGLSTQNAISVFLQSLAVILGAVGFILGTIGSVGLLLRRTFNEDLRSFAAPADYFNLVFILAIFLSGLLSWLYFDSTLAVSREYMKSLITFSPIAVGGSSLVIHIILLSLFLIYLPFTHMTHFIGKYFTWHEVRWDDRINIRGSDIEAKVNKLLNVKQTWSAPHMKPGKTWAEIATEEVE